MAQERTIPMNLNAGLLSPIDREFAVLALESRLAPTDVRAFMQTLQGQRSQRRSVERIVTEAERAGERRLGRPQIRLPDKDLTTFLVDFAGLELLSHRELRRLLALTASPSERDILHEFPSNSRGRSGVQSIARAIAARKWHPGKAWPLHFARVLGFPAAFAGLPGSPSEPDTTEVEPFRPLPPLEPFQDELLAQVRDVLMASSGSNRGILTLPTGAGKTRTAVEAILGLRQSATRRSTVLWVAQSEELCEQAVQAFREVWIDYGHRKDAPRDSLLISRLWGAGRKVPATADVVVASVQKLHAIWRGEDDDSRRDDLASLVRELGAVVVDEAHRMLAPSYSDVLEFAGIDLARDRTSFIPLLGLTATPFRGVADETRNLAARFHGKLVRPASLGGDPVGMLRAQGVLSHPDHEVLRYDGRAIVLDQNPAYTAYFERFGDFHPGVLEDLGEESVRNRLILERLCQLPADWPVLFFGCSVEQATAISVMLRRRGRSAATVTADTRAATRRALVEEFRAGNVSVLCNFGCLTTGFDAPRVRALVIARPTTSAVLYEQMIGRGMRGPRFGGTDRCLVIDVEDNIQFGGQMAFTRYAEYWMPELPKDSAVQDAPVALHSPDPS
jgi:DNA repair protein RadD